MQYSSSDALDGTPNAPPKDAADGCYAFSPSCGTASSYVSMMDRMDEFECPVPTKGSNTPLRPTAQPVNRTLDTHATTGASCAGAARPPLPSQGAHRPPSSLSSDQSSLAMQNFRTYGHIDDVVAGPASAPASNRDVALPFNKHDRAYTCWLQGSPISSIHAGDTPVHQHGVVAGEERRRPHSENVDVFRPTVDSGGTKTFAAAAAVITLSTPSLSSASLPARTEGTRRPPSSSISPATTFAQTRHSDVAELRSHLSALLQQQALGAACSAAAQCDGTVSEGDGFGDRGSAPPSSSSLRCSDSGARVQGAAFCPGQLPTRTAHAQARTSQSLERPSSGAASSQRGRRMPSFSTPPLAPDATSTLGRASESFLRSMPAHQQLPHPPITRASEGIAHVASTGHISRVSQDVRHARAQQAFDAQASELEQQLDAQLGLVFTLMRQVMVLDAHLAARSAADTGTTLTSSGADSEEHRELLVGQLEEAEDATVSTALHFVELANRHALEWMNQGQYSAALQLLQRAGRLLRKGAGRVFRYLPDPVELEAPSINGAAGGRNEPRDGRDTTPLQRPTAASSQARSHDRKSPTMFTSSDSGADINHISNDNVFSISAPFFSPSQEPRRLKAVAAVEHNLGVYHFKLGEYTLASALFARSAALEEELQAPGIGITYFNMAQTQHGLRQLTEALRYAEMAEEAVERQVFQAKDKATQMRRRLTQGRAFQARDFPDGARAASRGGEDNRDGIAAAANASAEGHRYSDAAATTEGEEEKALMCMWLQWRESVCFLSYVKQTHARWLDEMGLYKEAYQQYQQAHRWLLAIPRLATEEQQRAQLLKQYMATMKTRWRREEVEVELYRHPLRISSASSSGAVPAGSYPSHNTRSPSKHRARTHQRPQRSPAVLSAAVPIPKDFTSPLQSTVVTSVLPRNVEVVGRCPRGPSRAFYRESFPTPHEAPFLWPSASAFALRNSMSSQPRRRPSSANAVLHSLYAPRRPPASLLRHRPSATNHATASAEQNHTSLSHPSPETREQQQHGGKRASWDPSVRVPIPPPGRRTEYRTSTGRAGPAASGPLMRCTSASLLRSNAGEPEMDTTAHLPPRASFTPYDAHTRSAPQHHPSPPREPPQASSTLTESFVAHGLLFETEPETPKSLPHHRHSEPVFPDALTVESMQKAAADPPGQRSGAAATPQKGSAGAGVSDLAASAPSAARQLPELTPSPRIPGDLTWCVTVLQAFLRPRCRHRTLLDTEGERDRGKYTHGGRDTIESPQRSCPAEAPTLKSELPSHAVEVEKATMLDGDGTSRDAQPLSLPPKSAAALVVRRAELQASQPYSVDVPGALVSGTVGSVLGSKPATQPSLSASSPSWAAVGRAPCVESGDLHAEAAVAGKEDIVADARHYGEDVCVDLAAAEHEWPNGPARDGVSAGQHASRGSLGGEDGGHVAVDALIKRRKSVIPYESDDGEASSGSAARAPSGSRSPDRFHSEGFHGAGDSADAAAPTATREYVVTYDSGAVMAVASASFAIRHEKNEGEIYCLHEPGVVDGEMMLKVEPPDSGRRGRMPVSADALLGREGDRCCGDASVSTSKTNAHNTSGKGEGDAMTMLAEEREDAPGNALVLGTRASVPEEAKADSLSALPQLNAGDGKDSVVASLEMRAHKEDQHLVCEAQGRGTAAQRTASRFRAPADKVLRAEQAELACAEAAVAGSLSARHSTTLNKVASSVATVAEAFASAANDYGDMPKLSSLSPTSWAARRGTRAPFQSPRDAEARERGLKAVPAPAALSHSSHSPVSQAPQGTSQRADQVDGSCNAELGAAGEAEASNFFCAAAHATLSDRSGEDDVSDRTAARKAALSDSPTPPSAFSACAENVCPSSVEDTAPPGGSSMRASISATSVRFAAYAHEAPQKVGSSASACTGDPEVEGDNGPASEALHQETEGEWGSAWDKGSSAAPEASAASGGRAASSGREAAGCGKAVPWTEKVNDATDALAVTVAFPGGEAEAQLTTPADNDGHAHQSSHAATLFSPTSRSGESRRGDSPTTTSAERPPHNEGADLQWSEDFANARATAEERSAEVSAAIKEGPSPEEAVVAPQPLATLPPRRGRIFVFAPHQLAASASMELTNVNFRFRSGDAFERIRSPTRTQEQPAATLDTDTVEDGAAKPVLLRVAGGGRTSGSSDGSLCSKEGYCCAAAMMAYATAEDETVDRRTASIGSTTTQITQLRGSSSRSIHDGNDLRLGDGESPVKPEAVELAKSIARGSTMAPSSAIMHDRSPLPSASVNVAAPSEAPVTANEDVAQAEDKDVKRLQRARQDLLSTHETDIIENMDTPPPCTTSAPNTPELLDPSKPPCSSAVFAPIAASVAVAPVEAPRGSGRAAEWETKPSTAVPLPLSPRPESPAALPEAGERAAGLLSPRNCPLDREGDLLGCVHGGDADEATPPGKGDALATTEGETALEVGTNHPVNALKDGMAGAHEKARLKSGGAHGTAVASHEVSAGHLLPPHLPAPFHKPRPQQQRLGTNESTWSDMETDEAQRRYIRDQIVQEEAAGVIQQAWRDCVAARMRRQLHLLW
ncbi:hypothetical protein conserved [Leishmania donovani]|nr:hypothetical protein conserved [Leishmania donovani]